jgi:MoaA/NifB/PqqE/SkfB family radical SAM enzyme
MQQEQKYLDTFRKDLDFFFDEAVELNLTKLRQCGFWIRTMNHQTRAAEIRSKRIEKGLPAPPVLICSITSRCNLKCRGCYAAARKDKKGMEISTERFERLSKEAAGIGTNIILLAGGEPLLRKDILEAAARSAETIFPVFTNGTMLDSDMVRFFKKNRNLIPVLSMEGDRKTTDDRRGVGLYSKVISSAEVMHRSKMFYGLSITLTRNNFDRVTDPAYLELYHKLGCRLFFFVEYVPQSENELDICLSSEQKEMLKSKKEQLKEKLPALYVCMPGEEEKFGGCLAAGRGFVHVSPQGDLEACPFAPYSDSNIINMPLTEALDSMLLNQIRENHYLLKESEGGCALWENREWVEELLESPGSMSA